MRRTILTAINVLKEQLENGTSITLVLFPYAREMVSSANDLPVSRENLLAFIEDQQNLYSNLIFDFRFMDELKMHQNIWFIEIL
jgi:hypothetical protein